MGQPYIFGNREMIANRDLFSTCLSIKDTNKKIALQRANDRFSIALAGIHCREQDMGQPYFFED